jgi:serine carboxypeptidase-like clade I
MKYPPNSPAAFIWIVLVSLQLCWIAWPYRFAEALPLEDEIQSLPLWDGPLPSPQFSGYLNGTDGCNTKVNGPFCYIHYWFCLAEDGTSSYHNHHPVVVWLNGGPGSSSILGLLQELGPLLINATGDGFMENPFSWTRIPANVLVLESPVGVGYSYCSAQEYSDQICQNTDRYTASTARAAIVDFFREKFPEFRSNPFFITGESYAGVYVPTLTYELIQYNRQAAQHNETVVNLKGIAVGDPCTDNEAQADSMDALWYGNKYGLVDDQIFDVLWNTCEIRIPTALRTGRVQIRHSSNVQNSYLRNRKKELQQQIKAYALRQLSSWVNSSKAGDVCDLAWKKFLFSSSNALSQGWDQLYVDDYSLYAFVSNDEDDAMQQYMNRPDVREALHVTQTPNVEEWPYPRSGFDYTKEYNACNDDAINTDALSMIDFYRKIVPVLPAGVWIYNGDTDPCVSYEGTRTAVKRIGYPELDGGGYRQWFYNHTAVSCQLLQEKAIMFGPNLVSQNAGIQMGGEVVQYESGLSFLTIHGSGHMVPQFRPQAAFHFVSKFLHYQALSPLLPTNASLLEFTDAEFDAAMEDWTVKAKSSPYVVP